MKSYPKKQIKEDISKFKGDLSQVIVFLHTFKTTFQNKSYLSKFSLLV